MNYPDVKLERYKTLEELYEDAPRIVSNIDKQFEKGGNYIGIGADFWIINKYENKEFASLDFINRKIGENKFDFSKDIETLNLELPEQVRMKFSKLMEIL